MNKQFRMYGLAAEGLAALLTLAQLPPVAKPDVPAGQRDETSDSPISRPPIWYDSTGVRDQLKLTDAQLEQLREARNLAWERYRTAIAELPKGLSDDQRRLREQELLAAYHQELGAMAEKLFTDPRALRRFNQLEYQYRGYDAFTDASLLKQLRLSEEQRRQLIEANREWERQMSKYRRSYEHDRDSTIVHFNQSRREIDEGIRSVLTPGQQRTWRELTGEPYEFPPDAYFPARRDNLRRPGAVTPSTIQ